MAEPRGLWNCGSASQGERLYIGLHGIWSWISDENRQVIVDLLRRKLKVGGVLYISYNTLPGWAAFAPMRHLMTEHAEALGAEGQGIANRIDGAIGFAEQLLATNPLYSRANPQVGERLTKMKAHNRQYLAHEYFNRDWHPMHFATMADWLQDGIPGTVYSIALTDPSHRRRPASSLRGPRLGV